jgi:hypothetical protein
VSVKTRLARVHPFVWLAGIAVIGGLIAWPLGGWDTVELQSTKIPVVAAGTVVEGHQYSVEVDSAQVTDVHPDGYSEAEPGWEWLVLAATISNNTDATRSSFQIASDSYGVITIDDGALGWGTTALAPNGYVIDSDNYLVADGTFSPDLQPGLASPLTLVFPVPIGTWSPGDTMTVGIVDRTSYQQSLSTGIGWWHPNVIANVDLTVEQGAIAPPPDGDAVP